MKYRDTIIVFCKWLKNSAFSMFGIIFAPTYVEDNIDHYNTWLSHEFGHTLQYRKYGFLGYLFKVAIPSLFNFIKLQKGIITNEEYDNLWFENEATILGENWGDFND